MIRHASSGRTLFGLTLAILTTLQWGTQGVLLKILLGPLDVYTIGWARFLTSAIILCPLVLHHRGLRALLRLRGWPLLLLLIAIGALLVNYLTFMVGLEYVSPGTAQVLMQLGPIFVLVGSMVLFGESFSRLQWAGVVVLLAGLALFFNPRREELFADFDAFGVGIVVLCVSALLWGVYLLAQKQLLTDLKPEWVLFAIYATGAIALLPVARFGDFLPLEALHWTLLGGSCLITVLSYFTYAHSVAHAEASRIGVIFSLSPLVIFAMAWLFSLMLPDLMQPERLSAVSITGAMLVVAGSMLAALGNRGTTRRETPEAVTAPA